MMILDAKTLGKRIRSERMRIGLTQEEFAEMLNISTSYYARIESGIRMPSLELVIQIVELTNYSLDCLIFGESKTEKIKVELQMAINTLTAIKKNL